MTCLPHEDISLLKPDFTHSAQSLSEKKLQIRVNIMILRDGAADDVYICLLYLLWSCFFVYAPVYYNPKST